MGFATQLLIHTRRNSFRIASIGTWLAPPIRLSQIELTFDPVSGEPRAFATWAFLSDAVSDEFSRDDERLLHLSEWNEGDNLWIIDIVAPFGGAREILSRLKSRFGHSWQRVRAIRRSNDGAIMRIIDIRLTGRSVASAPLANS